MEESNEESGNEYRKLAYLGDFFFDLLEVN
jgi:hypothetical protein